MCRAHCGLTGPRRFRGSAVPAAASPCPHLAGGCCLGRTARLRRSPVARQPVLSAQREPDHNVKTIASRQATVPQGRPRSSCRARCPLGLSVAGYAGGLLALVRCLAGSCPSPGPSRAEGHRPELALRTASPRWRVGRSRPCRDDGSGPGRWRRSRSQTRRKPCPSRVMFAA